MVEEMSVFWFDYLPHGCLSLQVGLQANTRALYG